MVRWENDLCWLSVFSFFPLSVDRRPINRIPSLLFGGENQHRWSFHWSRLSIFSLAPETLYTSDTWLIESTVPFCMFSLILSLAVHFLLRRRSSIPSSNRSICHQDDDVGVDRCPVYLLEQFFNLARLSAFDKCSTEIAVITSDFCKAVCLETKPSDRLLRSADSE